MSSPQFLGLMWTGVVILSEPVINDGLRLFRRREPLSVEDLVPESAVKPLVVSVFPG